jgi:UDP-glucose:(heptosyl)LPS alpha-1,3-glucosyltransferase
MRLAFVLYKYFPYGGLQRDMLRIAAACRQAGHQVRVYTLAWEGAVPEGVEVFRIQVKRVSSHARNRDFSSEIRALLAQNPVDLVIGFNKMPGLDVYYAADGCLREKLIAERSWLSRLAPRYRHFLDYEAAVFAPSSRTKILMISPRQCEIFTRHYGTPEERIHMLPPGIDRDRMAGADAAQLRASFRQEFAVADDDRVVLCIGSGFKTKGLDRSLRAFAALPPALCKRSHLIAIGEDNASTFSDQARQLGVGERFQVLRGRDDIPRILQGGDILLHPAYYENTGTVLLEAVVAGLPVLTTDTCGYAFHVERAAAGRVLGSPFHQDELDAALAQMLQSPQRDEWARSGIEYGRTQDLYSMPELAADLISQIGAAR